MESISQPRLSFLDMFNLPNLSRLTNDQFYHDPTWPLVSANILSDILKFEGNKGEDPGNHIINFHL